MDQAWFFQRLESLADRTAFALDDRSICYSELLEAEAGWSSRLAAAGVAAGDVVAVVASFSPSSTAALLALFRMGAIAAPLTRVDEGKLTLCGASFVVEVAADGTVAVSRRDARLDHPLLDALRAARHPGMILFTSGSTGVPKAIVLDFVKFAERFRQPRRALRTLTLLMFDHIGGVTTLFGILGYGGTAVMPTPPRRAEHESLASPRLDPSLVCELVQRHRVELMPASPTFLRMLLVSDAHRRFDLGSLKVITYGSEPMYPATLREICAAFPGVELKQTYGSSEMGILRTRTPRRDSLWITIGGPMVETKVVDGQLSIRAPTAMLGYLNAASPFDADGWYDTGDQVEQDGDRFLIRGRISDIINVGGEKVFPAEVEGVLMQAPNVRDVAVFGRRNPVTGQVVAARVAVVEPEDESQLGDRLQKFCSERLEGFKVPVLVTLAPEIDHTNGKKKRSAAAP